MTLNERNAQLQDLRTRLAWLRTEQLAVEARIRRVNQEYKDEVMFAERSLYQMMFEVDTAPCSGL